MAFCDKSSTHTEDVRVNYEEDGDKIHVYDRFDNDRKTLAKVWVRGSGTARFYTGTHNEDYTEGKDIKVMVCTSNSPNAKCSNWSPIGTT
jgi:hypothetical protein